MIGLRGATLAPPTPASGVYSVQPVFSSEFHPKDSRWFSNPWSPTDPDWRYKLSPQNPLWLTKIDSSLNLTTIHVDSTKNVNYPRYSMSSNHLPDPSQPVLGMGTSLEETSVYALSKNHDDVQTEAALKDLIDPVNGIGMNLFRLCIGTSDFADGRSVTNDPKNPRGWYSYQDGGPNSPFSIQHDLDLNIVHVVKLAQDVAAKSNHPIKFFASAWSPPGWMKDSNSLVGGTLLDSMVPAYAAYLRKFVQAYQAQGIPIYAITTNNEHYYAPNNYPGCFFDAGRETKLVKAIAKEFAQNKISTKIWILDHNYIESPGARNTLKGLGAEIGDADSIAYHHYDGPISYMTSTHGSFPSVGIQFTEGSTWGTVGMDEIAQIFRNNSSSYVSWVTMTTQKPTHIQGPYNTPGDGPGTLSPTLLMRNNNTDTGKDTNPDYYKIPEYYLYGQFMKFVKPGAECILSDYGSASNITNVAFKNPDGTIAIVVINQNNWDQNVRFVVDGSQFVAVIPAATVATYVLKGDLAPSTIEPVGLPVLSNPIPPPTGTGAVVQEWFLNPKGTPNTAPDPLTHDSRYPDHPSGASFLNSISTHDQPAWNNANAGTRIVGCVVPNVTGNYRFYVLGNGWAQLSLSTDETPANLKLIATCPVAAASFYDHLGPGQQGSAPIALTSGRKYYFETLQLGGGGNGLTQVAWDIPGIANGRIISGRFLVPATATPPPMITNRLSVEGTAGVAFSFQLSASNTPWAYSATGLPMGLTLNTQTGAITGTPTKTGTSKVTLSAMNAGGLGSANLAVTVGTSLSAPMVTSPTIAAGVVGTVFSYTITGSNNPTSFGATGLPSGWTVDPTTGVISGTPNVAGPVSIRLSVTNSIGTGFATLTLTVSPSSYNSWLSGFNMQELSTSATATPLNDGVPNLLKYLFDIDPSKPMTADQREALPIPGIDSTTVPGTQYLTLTYRRNSLLAGVNVDVQSTSDFQSWTSVVAPKLRVRTLAHDLKGDPLIEVGVPMPPLTDTANFFIRLSVTPTN